MNLDSNVNVVVVDQEWLNAIWDKVKDYDLIYPDRNKLNFEYAYINANLVIYEKGLIFRVDQLVKGHRANVHGVFLNNPYKHIDKIRFLICWLFDSFNLQRVECYIPSKLLGLKKFMEKIGFSYEGCLRKARKYGRIFIDIDSYSVIKEDINGWRL